MLPGYSKARFNNKNIDFEDSFQDKLNSLNNCDMDVKSCICHLRCHFFLNERCTLRNKFNKTDSQLSKWTLPSLTNTLLFGNLSFGDKINTLILDTRIKLMLSTKRFQEHLFWVKYIAIQYKTVYILVVFDQTF